MYTTKSFTKGVLSLSLVAVLSGYVLAAEQPKNQMSGGPDQRETMQQEALAGPTGGAMHRASQIMGQQVRNPQGEKLGTVYDIVLTEDLDSVSYLALSRGGIFGLGRTLHAVPWKAVQVGVGGEPYIVSISRQDLEQTRGFPSGNWPANVERGWTLEDTDQGKPTYQGYTPEESRAIQTRRFSRLRGSNVRTADGESGGSIRDLVIATDTSRVAYTIVSLGGFFGLGQQYAAVPQSAVTYLPGARTATIDASRETLQANAFSPGQFPNMADPAYAQNINRTFGMETDGTVLGYVPAEEPAREPAATHRMPAPDKTGQAPAPGAIKAPRIDANATFDPSAVTTIQGTVTGVGKFDRDAAGVESLLLRVQTDKGDLLNVHAGPLDYVSKQDFYAVSGDRLSITGAPPRTGDRSVFLATQITKGDKVLRVRNPSGEPLWDEQHQKQSGATTHTSGQHAEGPEDQTTAPPEADETPGS